MLDRSASAVFQLHYLGLVRLAYQFVDHVETAEDVVQDVFARLPRSLTSDDPLRDLRVAVLNGARSVFRRRQTARAFRWNRPEMVAPADTALMANAEREHLLAAIDRLPARQKEVIVLRWSTS